MIPCPLVLVGSCPELEGLRWQSTSRLRIGRHEREADVVLHDPTVSVRHAEIVPTREGWVVRDLGSKTGTRVNGQLTNGKDRLLRDQDHLQIGRIRFRISLAAGTPPLAQPPVASAQSSASPGHETEIRTSGAYLKVQAVSQRSWEEVLEGVTPLSSQGIWHPEHVRALLRASQSITKLGSLEELLQSILEEVFTTLKAQRAAIVLAEPLTGELTLRAAKFSRPSIQARGTFSRTLAKRSFQQGESLLCADVQHLANIDQVGSVLHGAMTSIICALLRTPRHPLGVLHLDRGPLHAPFTREDFHLADAIAAMVSVGIESAQLVEKQREQFVQTVAALGRAVEVRDLYTANHTNRVTAYALILAEALDVPRAEQRLLQVGTPLHDVGKIGVEDAILRKPDRLTGDEYEKMKQHTVLGAAILETIPALRQVIPIARHHHERWDGAGYPDGLAGQDIALTARIVAVADAFDAMTSDRPYCRALPMEQAFRELQAGADTHFDPQCVQAFLAQREAITAVASRPESGPSLDVLLRDQRLMP